MIKDIIISINDNYANCNGCHTARDITSTYVSTHSEGLTPKHVLVLQKSFQWRKPYSTMVLAVVQIKDVIRSSAIKWKPFQCDVYVLLIPHQHNIIHNSEGLAAQNCLCTAQVFVM